MSEIVGSDLPYGQFVDSRTLSRLFDNTTNSYKYLFFLALLNWLESCNFDADSEVTLDELAIDMLCLAWYPHVYFKLSFGYLDKIGQELQKIFVTDTPVGDLFYPRQKQHLRQKIKERFTTGDLTRFVPYRLIRPFFPEIKTPDHKVNEQIVEMSRDLFETRKPLYRFTDDRRKIQMHPQWILYFKENLPIVRGWVHWQWLCYMQARNPSVPAIAKKLFPVIERESMEKQKQYWQSVLQNSKITCIYSGEQITAQNLSLDHFVPWTFVCHDQLWNLIPTVSSVNSAKSNCLPADRYFKNFVQTQSDGLRLSHKTLPAAKWQKMVEPYILELKLQNYDQLLDEGIVFASYQKLVPPLMALARINGFGDDWQYAARV